MFGIKLSRVVMFLTRPIIWLMSKLPMERDKRIEKIMTTIIK
jgi:hypothetical protein